MKALDQLSYGTFVLTIKKENLRNGCILNTVIQIDEDTLLMSLQNFSYSNSLLDFNDYVTIHTIHNQSARSIFENFGWKSGRSEDKFKDVNYIEDDHFIILCDGINNYFNGRIKNKFVLDTHTLYVVHIIKSEVINEIPSLTYKEYQEYTKPKRKTYRNLKDAFCNESMARNKYTFYATLAKKEGYANIAKLFERIAGNEKEHGEIWAKQLNLIHDRTSSNLKDAILSENKEWQEDYKRFEQEAIEEGYEDIAELFRLVQVIEKDHASEFTEVYKQLDNDSLFKDEDEVLWICQNCGYIYTGKVALMKCPMCDHPQSYMERKC